MIVVKIDLVNLQREDVTACMHRPMIHCSLLRKSEVPNEMEDCLVGRNFFENNQIM